MRCLVLGIHVLEKRRKSSERVKRWDPDMKLDVYVSDPAVLSQFPAWLRNSYVSQKRNIAQPGETILLVIEVFEPPESCYHENKHD
jgi:hypothetical protein